MIVSNAHWADTYKEWLLRLSPELGARPLYVVSETELPEWLHVGTATAWTSPDVDLKMREGLESRLRWRGRGSVIVVCPHWFTLSENDRLAILAHEAAHLLSSWRDVLPEPDEMGAIQKALLLEGGAELVRTEFRKRLGNNKFEELFGDDVCTNEAHGSQFVRAALHLWRRSHGQLMINAMGLFNEGYQCNDPQRAVAALEGEFEQRGNLIELL
ncbi:MAG: hypothetical protein ABGZ35_20155 [Planctomycetaceae bacterium]